MRKLRKRTFRKVIQVLEFRESDDLGWAGKRKVRRKILKRNWIFEFLISMFRVVKDILKKFL